MIKLARISFLENPLKDIQAAAIGPGIAMIPPIIPAIIPKNFISKNIGNFLKFLYCFFEIFFQFREIGQLRKFGLVYIYYNNNVSLQLKKEHPIQF